MSFHEFAPRGDVHGIHFWTYATNADRDAHNPSEGPARAINATDVLHKRICFVTADDKFYVLTNHSPVTWKPFSEATISEQKDLLDNNTDFVVVGDKTTDRVVILDYSFQLPIGGRELNGRIVLLHDGATAEIINNYSFIAPEITTVTFGAAISGNDLRLTIVTSGIGENPKLVYSRFKLGFAA